MKALRDRQAWASEAILVQNACNPSGVTHALSRYFEWCSQNNVHQSTDDKGRDPIVRLFIYKLCDLCRMTQDPDMEFTRAYEDCMALTDPVVRANYK